MPIKNIHDEPFSEETLLKLEIFREYVEAWLPVFIKRDFKQIGIFDFFAGAGYDSAGNPGSPILLLDAIVKFEKEIRDRDIQVNLCLNEFDKDKHKALRKAIEEWRLKTDIPKCNLFDVVESKDFRHAFSDWEDVLKMNMPKLIYLDQNGIKHVTEDVFKKLESLKMTDFMFFISSSYFSRFGQEDSFKQYFPDIDQEQLRKVPRSQAHSYILDYYKSKLPRGSSLKLYPFSFKKGPNIYGIIFGAKHPLAIQKFLDIAWVKAPENGQANYDIHNDAEALQGDFFDAPKLTREEQFEQKLWKFLSDKQRCTNRDILELVFEDGFSRKKAKDMLSNWKNAGKIRYSGQSGLSYEACYSEKKKRIVQFEIIP